MVFCCFSLVHDTFTPFGLHFLCIAVSNVKFVMYLFLFCNFLYLCMCSPINVFSLYFFHTSGFSCFCIQWVCNSIDIDIYHSHFIPGGVAEVSQIFLRDTHFYQNELAVKNTEDVTGGNPIAVVLQSILGVSAINPLVAFYDIHGGKRVM
jgi:hypothetical protein